MKIAETRDLEEEVQRLRNDNADLKKHTAELANVEAARKKAELRAEQLEEKVRTFYLQTSRMYINSGDV